jgi:Ca2+-binding EF-hand superfamily protein
LTGLSVFCPSASHAEKLKFSFDIYDKNRDGSIAKSELHEMLESTLLESSNAGLSKDQIAALIDAIFVEADSNGDGEISFQE